MLWVIRICLRSCILRPCYFNMKPTLIVLLKCCFHYSFSAFKTRGRTVGDRILRNCFSVMSQSLKNGEMTAASPEFTHSEQSCHCHTVCKRGWPVALHSSCATRCLSQWLGRLCPVTWHGPLVAAQLLPHPGNRSI